MQTLKYTARLHSNNIIIQIKIYTHVLNPYNINTIICIILYYYFINILIYCILILYY